MLKTNEGQRAGCKFRFERVRYCHFLVLSRGNVERFDQPTSGSIGVSTALHLLPEFTPVGIG